jgi:SAM-dependent methyltransferase
LKVGFEMRLKHLSLLTSPKTGMPLSLEVFSQIEDMVEHGLLKDDQGNVWKITDFIPRFVLDKNYGNSFGTEWEQFPDILYQYDGYPERFAKETKWPSNLKNELILEAGCGAGPFTAEALKRGATVVSFDISSAVDVNYGINGANTNLLIVQASIEEMPFSANSFDRVFCFGVLQHTSNPKQSLHNLISRLQPGGSIATDIYLKPPFFAYLERAKYFWRKILRKRFSNEKLNTLIPSYVKLSWPIVSFIEMTPLRKVNRWFLFDNYKQRLPGMLPEKYPEFATLDIVDFLTPTYDFPETLSGFKQWFLDESMIEVDVHIGYNGLEGRAIKKA